MYKYASLFVSLALLAACGSSDGQDPAADAAVNNSADAAVTGDWIPLIEGPWTIPPASEEYVCVYKTIEQDTWIKAFKAVIPNGTHHTVLTIGNRTREDGVAPCNAGTNYDTMVFGSGVGTGEIQFPAGVALKVNAGQQLLLNLHLFNVSDSDLSGTSGTDIQTMNAADVQNEAEALMIGKFTLNIPPAQESTHTGTCVMNGNVTVFGFQPHMHMLGTYMKVEADGQIVWDRAYTFDSQVVERVGPFNFAAGTPMYIHCTYFNTTNQTVNWGDSSLDEMCLAALYRYPKFGGTAGPFCGSL